MTTTPNEPVDDPNVDPLGTPNATSTPGYADADGPDLGAGSAAGEPESQPDEADETDANPEND